MEGAGGAPAIPEGRGLLSGGRRRPWGPAAGFLSAVLLFPLAAARGCDQGTEPSPPRVPVGREFTLAIGEAVEVEGAGLVVRMEAVEDDSRCPVDVTCVWEGDATVTIAIVAAGGGSTTHALHLTTSPHEATSGEHRVRLLRLAPPRRESTPPVPADYRATLVVVAR